MGSLAQVKTLGGVGSILAIMAIVPNVGFVLAIVGEILVLVAIKYISDALGDIMSYNCPTNVGLCHTVGQLK